MRAFRTICASFKSCHSQNIITHTPLVPLRVLNADAQLTHGDPGVWEKEHPGHGVPSLKTREQTVRRTRARYGAGASG